MEHCELALVYPLVIPSSGIAKVVLDPVQDTVPIIGSLLAITMSDQLPSVSQPCNLVTY